MATQGFKGKVLGQTGVPVAFTNLPTTDVSPAGALRTVYQITDTTKRFWDDAVAPTVQTSPDGTTWTAATGYAVQYLGGKVIFPTSLALGTQIRISAGTAYPMASFANFTMWELSGEVEMLEDTTIDNPNGVKTYTPGLFDGTCSVEGWHTDSYFYDKLSARAVAVVSLQTTGAQYDCYALVSKVSPKVEAGALQAQSREFQIKGSVYVN